MFTSFEHCQPITLLPGFEARFIHTETQTFSLVTIEKGAVLPEHAHFNEQFSRIIEGTFKLTVDGNSQICKKGDVALIKSNAPHSGKALTRCVIFDVFNPAREDYRSLSISPEKWSN